MGFLSGDKFECWAEVTVNTPSVAVRGSLGNRRYFRACQGAMRKENIPRGVREKGETTLEDVRTLQSLVERLNISVVLRVRTGGRRRWTGLSLGCA